MTEIDFLKRVSLFAGVEEEDLKNIAAIMRERSYRKNQVIFYEDDPGDTLYIVKSGTVRIYQLSEAGHEKTLAVFKEGDSFGEMSLIEEDGRSATAETMEPSVLLVIGKSHFLELLQKSPSLSMATIRMLTQRLRSVNKQLGDALYLDVRSRTRKILKQMTLDQGEDTGEGMQIRVPLTHKELAKIVGSSRETVTKILLELQDEQVITIEKKWIVVRDPDQLYIR